VTASSEKGDKQGIAFKRFGGFSVDEQFHDRPASLRQANETSPFHYFLELT
jgi:hypothetical protein